MDITRDITFHYIARLRHHTDELGLVVQGHLLIEYVLNELIRAHLKQPSRILNDHRSYSFAIKARVLFAASYIPQHIFSNIQRVNEIRNHLAHTLQWKSLQLDYCLSRDDEKVKGDVPIKDRLTGHKPTRRKYIKLLCLGTLTQLRNHFFETMGRFPAPAELP